MVRKFCFAFLVICLCVILVGAASAAMDDDDFIELCKDGSPQELEAAIKAGANINAVGFFSTTPLVSAAERNSNPEVITVLVNAGADVHARDRLGITVLMRAAILNPNPEVITALINAGADIYAEDISGNRAVDSARANNNPAIHEMLLKKTEKGRYSFVDRLLLLDGAFVDIDENTESADVSFNGKNYKVIMPLDAGRTGEAEVNIGVFAVLDGKHRVAQLQVMEYQYFFDDEGQPFLSPTGKYLFSSSGTSNYQDIVVYTFPDLKEAASFGGYSPLWNGDERIYFNNEALKPSVIDIKSGAVKER